MQPHYFFEVQLGKIFCRIRDFDGKKVCGVGQPIHNDLYPVMLASGTRNPNSEIHINILPHPCRIVYILSKATRHLVLYFLPVGNSENQQQNLLCPF